MLYVRRKGWEIAEKLATSEHVYLNRRALIGGATAALALRGRALADQPPLYPAKRNPAYSDAGHEVTEERYAADYNNYVEMGDGKHIAAAAAALKTSPWSVTVDGEVEKPQTFDLDALIRQVGLEERIYRHRCVETWAMIVPWTGFPLAKLIALATPTSRAKFVRIESFNRPSEAPGQDPGAFDPYPWPYIEGLTVAEAGNDLPFLVTGAYGKPVPNSMGAPFRLHVPWKYGFKSAKGVVKITLTETRPVSFWERIGDGEYGFWANVNPKVDHPRWSQAQETLLGTGETVPTRLFNGYGEQVADLYKGMSGDELYR